MVGPELHHHSFQVVQRNGRHEETRTPDLYRVKTTTGCNLLIPGAPMAIKSTEKHSKHIFRTVVRTVMVDQRL